MSRASFACVCLLLFAPAAGAAPDPLGAARQGGDVAVRWLADPAGNGYVLYKVDRKDLLAVLPAPPVFLDVPQTLPPFPVLDAGAVAAAPALAFYQVFDRGGCAPGRDSDGDRLDDCVETDTGSFVSASDTGTDPFNPDTDGDGLLDGDEVLGTAAGLDLPALGASPVHKDLFIEYDWFDDAAGCRAHTHRPTQAMLDRVTATFAAAPLANPDGASGIAVHHDVGQGAPFTGGNLVADADGVIAGGVNGADFKAIKLASFRAERLGVFHYCLLPHRYNTASGSSGQAELPGNDFVVSLACSVSTENVANTIVHEIGHNFTLRHGGFENCNWKPNYNSVMNYKYQFPGVDDDCTPPGDGVLDYSRGTRIDLDENDLDEDRGTCGAPSVNWNGNGRLEAGIAYDLNRQGDDPKDAVDDGGCAAALTVLRDNDDWSQVDLAAGLRDADLRFAPVEVVDCNPNPPPPTER